MSRKLIIDGNAVYEIDEKCMLKKKLGELEEKKVTSDEKRAEQSVVTGKPIEIGGSVGRVEKISQKGHAVFPHAPFEVEEGTDISIRHSCSHYRNRRIRSHYCPIRRSSKEEG